LSQQVTGFLLAIGASTPEFTTNLLSSIQGKSEDAALGLGAITGSGSFGNLKPFYIRFYCLLCNRIFIYCW
jgi:Ca2+/Na+ antiporter